MKVPLLCGSFKVKSASIFLFSKLGESPKHRKILLQLIQLPTSWTQSLRDIGNWTQVVRTLHEILEFVDQRARALQALPKLHKNLATSRQPQASKNVSCHAQPQGSENCLRNRRNFSIWKKNGAWIEVRALWDSGLTINLITEHGAQKLGLYRKRIMDRVQSVGKTEGSKLTGTVDAQFLCHQTSALLPASLLFTKAITGELPNYPIQMTRRKQIQSLRMADPNFAKPGPVELLIGAALSQALVIDEWIKLKDSLFLRRTMCGWMLPGVIKADTDLIPQCTFHAQNLSTSLTRFWELEELPQRTLLSPEEEKCGEIFPQTTTRDEFGRFTVTLHFNSTSKRFGGSFQQANRRFLSLEWHLGLSPDVKKRYSAFIKEFVDLGYLEHVQPAEQDKSDEKVFHVPHHFVEKAESTTTQLRVVFDACAVTTNVVSLNDTLMIGPLFRNSSSIQISSHWTNSRC